MSRLDKLLDEDPVRDALGGSGRTKRLKRRLFGDPRKAPRRIVTGLLFLLTTAAVVAAWVVLTRDFEAESSSIWFVDLVATVAGSPWTAVPIALYVWYRFVGFRRSTYASMASEKTGWLEETIRRLSDEVRTTDGTTRVIVHSDHTREEIHEYLDRALRGEDHPATSVDFYGRAPGTDGDTDGAATIESNPSATALPDGETHALPAAEYDDLWDDPLDERLGEAAAHARSLAEAEWDVRKRFTPETHPECFPGASNKGFDTEDEILQRLWASGTTRDAADPDANADTDTDTDAGDTEHEQADGWLTRAGAAALAVVAPVWAALVAATDAVASALARVASAAGLTAPGAADDEPGEEIPWRVLFAEEIKHLSLDLAAAQRSAQLFWTLALPAVAVFAGLMLWSGIWVHPLYVLTYLLISLLAGVATFAGVKRRRSRRLRSYDGARGASAWHDVAARVKTVDTADTTAFIGFVAGRRYASYDRAEFIEEVGYRLQQKAAGQAIAPSILEKYARCLRDMHPNLDGFRHQMELPAIQNELTNTVYDAPDQLIDKAELAYRVIEHPSSDKYFDTDLGHDPRLVAEEYRFLVEDGHLLAEMTVDETDGDGDTNAATLVYPAGTGRPPNIQRIHSSISDRFHGAHMNAIYELPECDPSEDLRGHVPDEHVLSNLPDQDALPAGSVATDGSGRGCVQ